MRFARLGSAINLVTQIGHRPPAWILSCDLATNANTHTAQCGSCLWSCCADLPVGPVMRPRLFFSPLAPRCASRVIPGVCFLTVRPELCSCPEAGAVVFVAVPVKSLLVPVFVRSVRIAQAHVLVLVRYD